MSNDVTRSSMQDQDAPAAAGKAETSSDGAESPSRLDTSSAAGAASSSPQPPAASYEPDAAVGLLVQALREMQVQGSTTTAAGVSARMRQIDSRFSTGAAGFRNFRALLLLASERALIAIEEPEGASDLIVTLAEQEPVAVPRIERSGSAGSSSSVTWLRHDMWRALTDWSPTVYKYDRRTHRTGPLRDGSPEETSESVSVPTATPEQRNEWMNGFADTLDSELRSEALGALQQDPSGALFDAAVRSRPHARRRWEGFLRPRLIQLTKDWAEANSVPFEDVSEVAPSSASLQIKPATYASVPAQDSLEDQMRREVLEILSRMSLDDLLGLAIPVKYALRR